MKILMDHGMGALYNKTAVARDSDKPWSRSGCMFVIEVVIYSVVRRIFFYMAHKMEREYKLFLMVDLGSENKQVII